MKRPALVEWGVVAAVAVLVLAAGLWFGWPRPPAGPAQVATAAADAASAPSAEPAAATSASAPAEVALPEPLSPQPALVESDVGPALTRLLGVQSARQWLRPDGFVRRFVATVDNLGRAHAPALSWPVDPTPGRLQVVQQEGRQFIAPDNAQRYVPFVLALEAVDSQAAAALYTRLLPLLQSAHEELGYPRQRFHTRLMQLIDHLLAAPSAPERIEVRLTEVHGPIPSQRPWVRHEFADPALEAASAGHKLMVRVGAVNQRRLKAKLVELRAALQHNTPR